MIKLTAHPSPTNSYSTLYSLFSLNQQASSITFGHRGLAYGDGFFTTMGVHQGKILWCDYHAHRLTTHAIALQLDFDTNWVMAQLKVFAKQLDEGLLKVIISRKIQPSKSYGFVNSEAELFAQTTKQSMPTYHSLMESFTKQFQNGDSIEYTHTLPVQVQGQAVCLTSQISCLPRPLVGLKSLNRIDNVLAAGELEQIKLQFDILNDMWLKANTLDSEDDEIVGHSTLKADTHDDISHIKQAEINTESSPQYLADNHEHITYTDLTGINAETDKDIDVKIVEGLVSDVSGEWVEGVCSNVFYQLRNEKNLISHYSTWYTTPINKSGVNGVMRQLLMDKSQQKEVPIIERQLTDDDLPKLSALFFCNAVRGIIPISALHLLDKEKMSVASLTSNSKLAYEEDENDAMQVVRLSIASVNRFALQFAHKVIKPKLMEPSGLESKKNLKLDLELPKIEIQKLSESADSNEIRDKATQYNMGGYSVFYSLFHVQPLKDKVLQEHHDSIQSHDELNKYHTSKILGNAKGAFVNTYMLASSKMQFHLMVKEHFRHDGLEVIEIEDYENLNCTPDAINPGSFGLDEDSYEIVKALSPDEPIGLLYHVYEDEDE